MCRHESFHYTVSFNLLFYQCRKDYTSGFSKTFVFFNKLLFFNSLFLMFCLKLHTFFHVCNLRQNIKTNTFQELMVSENSQQCLWGGCRLRIVFPTRRNNWYLYNNNKSIQGHVTIIFGPSGLRVSTINGVFLSLSFFLSAWVTFLP